MPSQPSRNLNNALVFAIARITLLATSLFLGVTGFSILLSGSTLSNLSRQTRLSAYRGVGERLRLSIERGLRFGRPLNGYAGLKEQLENAMTLAPGLAGLAVVDKGGKRLYGAGSMPEADRAPPGGAVGAPDAGPGAAWSETAAHYVLFIPLHGRNRAREGGLLLAADRESVGRDYRGFVRDSVLLLLALSAVITLVQSGWIGLALCSGRRGADRRRSLHLVLLIFAGGGQIAYSLPSIMYFASALERSEVAKVEMAGKTVAQDLERLAGRGLRFEQISGLSAHFGDIVGNTPEIAAIVLREDGGSVVASQGEAPPGSSLVTLPVNLYWPNHRTPSRAIAVLEFWTNPLRVRSAVRQLYLNQLTTLAISLLLVAELARLVVSVGFRRGSPSERRRDAEEGGETTAGGAPLIRIFSFLFFFGYDMVLSFVPLAAKTLPGSFLALPAAQLAALPLTAEAILGGAGILAAGWLHRRVGFRPALRVGSACAMAGAVSAFLAPSISWFILARALAGLGFGIVFMACQFGLMSLKSEAGGLAQMYSGIFAGSLCGVAGGAMAAELSGFQNVFAFSAALFLAAMLLAGRFPRLAAQPPAGSGGASAGGALPFFLSREFLAPVLFVTLPISLSLAGFVYLGVPVELHRLGVPQSDIGRLFMVYGLCFILFGPILTRMSDRSGRYLFWVSASGAMNGLALVCAWMFPRYLGYAAAVALAGVANCIHASNILIYVRSGPLAGQCDKNFLGSVYRMAERGGHITGPVAFSLVSPDPARSSGLLLAGAVFFAAGLLLPLVRCERKA